MSKGEEMRLRAMVRRRLRLAKLALIWESLWPAAWPMVGIAGLFVAVALFDVLPHLASSLHALILAGFATAFGVAIWRGLSRFTTPTAEQVRRRVEIDSGLEHRPLAALEDEIAGNPRDTVSRALWREHRRRVAAAVARLRVRLPSPGMAAKDPLGLRAAVLLLLVIGIAGAGQDAPARVARALAPQIPTLPSEVLLAQLWLTPPAHTGLPPIFLDTSTGQGPPELRLPAGSSVLALIQGGDEAELRLDDTVLASAETAGGSQRLEGRIDGGDSLGVLVDGRQLARWPLEVMTDAIPSIAFLQPPQADEAARLRLSYQVSDDYGVTKAWMTIRRLDQPQAEPLVVELPAPGAAHKQAKLSSRHDLTAHAWAGLPVSITPTAEDALGQRGAGEAVNTILPERVFRHPVARAIVELRRQLHGDSRGYPSVMWGLDALSADPQAFGNDTVVFLALRTARARLQHQPMPEGIESVREILWNTALRVEEGDRGVAERALTAAAEALDKALREGAPQEEIDRLMDELQRAMQQYMQALAEQMNRQDFGQQPIPPNSQTITPQELQAMMDKMREMARLGSREAAQQMLSQLRDMLENLRAGMQGGPMDERLRDAQQAIQQLGEISRQQRQMMDQSFQQSQQPNGADPQAMAEGAEAQEGLRRQLGDLMRRLGEAMGDIPEALGAAEQAMRDATGRLRRNDAGPAAESQGEAVQRLQRGAEAAMQALAEQMQQGGSGLYGMPGIMRRDPLGRRMPNPLADDGSVHVPDEAEIHRAREVLEELRRRSGQPQRPQQERDYLERLLTPF